MKVRSFASEMKGALEALFSETFEIGCPGNKWDVEVKFNEHSFIVRDLDKKLTRDFYYEAIAILKDKYGLSLRTVK